MRSNDGRVTACSADVVEAILLSRSISGIIWWMVLVIGAAICVVLKVIMGGFSLFENLGIKKRKLATYQTLTM